MPEADYQEAQFLNSLLKNKSDEELQNFFVFYRNKRRDPLIILLTALAGFIGFAGIHRLLTDNIVLGIVYFFTAGFCFIGTIIDLINYKNLALEYNQKKALQIMNLYMG